MSTIKLTKNDGFSWFKQNEIYVKGFIYSNYKTCLTGPALCNYFKNINNSVDLSNKLSSANGQFSVIIKYKDNIFAAIDRLRSFPLFYTILNNNPIISDDPDEIIKISNLNKINSIREEEFLATGFVTGDKTLLDNLYQIQAGALLSVQNSKINQTFYHTNETSYISKHSYTELYDQLNRILENASKRLTGSLQGRALLLSLSGGYDSRLIASMLKNQKYENVICFSYGKKNNKEAVLSKQAAEKLNYKWIFIEYNETLISNYIDDINFKNYYKYASNFTSMFFLEQYFAVKALKEQYSIPHDSIFCAGHSGDFIAGSQLTKNGGITEAASFEEIVQAIIKTKYTSKKIDKSVLSIIKNELMQWLLENSISNKSLAYSIYENWDLKEKFAKFIFNSANVYNYFGFEHRLPLMENDLVDFFKTVPYKYKLYKILYDDVLKNEYFSKYDLNFETELQPTKSQIFKQKIKNKLYPLLPEWWLSKIRIKNDVVYYRPITQVLIDDAASDYYEIQPSGKNFNSIIMKWYMYQLHKNHT